MNSSLNEVKRSKPLLGTFVEITAIGANRDALLGSIGEAFDEVGKVHRLMNFHDASSEVAKLNREAFERPVQVSDWTFEVLSEAQKFSRDSGGIFDVTVASAHETDWTEAINYQNISLQVSDHRVRFLHPHTKIDLSGIAKGFAVDRAIEALQARGVDSALVNAGGDLRSFGAKTFSIQIRHPFFPGSSLMQIPLANEALANSGHYFGSLFIDTHAQGPAALVAAAGIRAPTCLQADALTKILMCQGEEARSLLEQYGVSGYFVGTSQGNNSPSQLWCYGKPWL